MVAVGIVMMDVFLLRVGIEEPLMESQRGKNGKSNPIPE